MLDRRFHRDVIKVSEAQNRIKQHMKEGGTEEITLEQSFGRRLAESIIAAHPMPHFRRSGMDGFAVRSVDIVGAKPETPVHLEVIEEIPCGSVPFKTLTSGTAARIMTGAYVPDGADAVIMLEMTETMLEASQQVTIQQETVSQETVMQEIIPQETVKANVAIPEVVYKTWVSIKKQMNSGDNVTPIGFEIKSGQLLLEKGSAIGPGETALLASFGHAKVTVYKQPRVAIFATGSELLPVNHPLEPGRIRNSNGYMIAAQVKAAGGIPLLMEIIQDDTDQAMKVINDALSSADLVITTGGVSVGDYDIMVDIFAQWDGQLLFNKIALRPGSPTTAGIFKDKFLIALSGNPGACFVGFELFVSPVLRGFQGMRHAFPLEYEAFLGVDYPKGNVYPRYIRGLSYINKGKIYVAPSGPDKSSIMTSIKDSDCLIIIPPGGKGLQADELVTVIKLK